MISRRSCKKNFKLFKDSMLPDPYLLFLSLYAIIPLQTGFRMFPSKAFTKIKLASFGWVLNLRVLLSLTGNPIPIIRMILKTPPHSPPTTLLAFWKIGMAIFGLQLTAGSTSSIALQTGSRDMLTMKRMLIVLHPTLSIRS